MKDWLDAVVLVCAIVAISGLVIGGGILIAAVIEPAPAAWNYKLATDVPVDDWAILNAIDEQHAQLRKNTLARLVEHPGEHGLFSVEMKVSEGRKEAKE